MLNQERYLAKGHIEAYLSDCREKNINPLCMRCLREYLDKHYGTDRGTH
jgi:hypothetical protein